LLLLALLLCPLLLLLLLPLRLQHDLVLLQSFT
jgi:hypothetical protein